MDMTTNPLLIERPAMYFGNQDGYLRDILAFDIGYTTATQIAHCFIPIPFKQYIIDTLAPNNPRGLTWFTLIKEHASGEKAEWDLFKRLWRDYDKQMHP